MSRSASLAIDPSVLGGLERADGVFQGRGARRLGEEDAAGWDVGGEEVFAARQDKDQAPRLKLASGEGQSDPDQTRGANQMGCWNWFRASDQKRGGGEAALLADIAATLASRYWVPSDQVFAAGLSAGGAMAAILGDTHPEVFAAVGVHSGLAPGSATDLAGAYAAMRGQGAVPRSRRSVAVRSIVFHGTADTTVAASNGDAIVAAALGGLGSDRVEDASVAGATVVMHRDCAGATLVEHWTLPGVGHAWSGGSPDGSYTHPSGPDASAEMVRFFLSVSEDRR